jgi:hypothetical protein
MENFMLKPTRFAIAVAALISSSAYAAPLTAQQMLQQFNVVVTGDLNSTSASMAAAMWVAMW